MVSKSWWLSGHEFESHHLHLFDKNQTQGNVSLSKFQAQIAFNWWCVLENNINYILEPSLKVQAIWLRWFFNMISEPWWLSDHEFESHHLYLFDKNQVQGNVSLSRFQAQRTWGGVLENNINHHILGLHLNIKLLGLNDFLTTLPVRLDMP